MDISPDAPGVACVVINWNNWQDTAACLDSLKLQDYKNLRVIVVDNASSNDSVAQLQARHPWAAYIRNQRNFGFPKACNIGARHPDAVSAPLIWFLNNDTVVPPDTASKLVAKAQATPRAGIIGAVLYFMDEPTRVQAWGGGSVSLWTGYTSHFTSPHLLHSESFLTFASVLVRAEVFRELHGLFEGAFMYFEDVDFCLRAKAAGWQLAVAENTAILHREGGANPRPTRAKDRIITSAGLIFLRRHSTSPAISGAIFLASRIAKRMAGLRFDAAAAVIQGARDVGKFL